MLQRAERIEFASQMASGRCTEEAVCIDIRRRGELAVDALSRVHTAASAEDNNEYSFRHLSSCFW
jgi:hypothetical protein